MLNINLLGIKFSLNVELPATKLWLVMFLLLLLNIFLLYPFAIWVIVKILSYCFGFSYSFGYLNYLGLSVVVYLITALFGR